MNSRGKNWCFTINNYTTEDIACIAGWDVVYVIHGKETGESGTPHLQGYVVVGKTARLTAMKKLHATAHWEVAKGSSEQNITYCSKDGNVIERGTRPVTKSELGKREKTNWDDAKTAAKEGRLDDIPSEIYFRFYRTAKEIMKDHMVKPADAEGLTGIWYYGPPGAGKSRQARIDYPEAYDKMQNKWWDGYQGQDNVIIDDFDSKELGHHLKLWGDRYSFLAETKGGAINIRPKKIVITSNYKIEDLFEDTVLAGAIKRRFTVTYFPLLSGRAICGDTDHLRHLKDPDPLRFC